MQAVEENQPTTAMRQLVQEKSFDSDPPVQQTDTMWAARPQRHDQGCGDDVVSEDVWQRLQKIITASTEDILIVALVAETRATCQHAHVEPWPREEGLEEERVFLRMVQAHLHLWTLDMTLHLQGTIQVLHIWCSVSMLRV